MGTGALSWSQTLEHGLGVELQIEVESVHRQRADEQHHILSPSGNTSAFGIHPTHEGESRLMCPLTESRQSRPWLAEIT